MATRIFVRSGFRLTGRCAALLLVMLGATTGRAESPELVMMTAHSREVNSLAFTRDGRRLLSASSDNTAVLWDVDSGDRLRTFAVHTDSATQLWKALFARDETQVVTVSSEKLILWDVATGERIRTFKEDVEYRHLNTAEITLDGQRLLTVGSRVLLWDIRTGELLKHADDDVSRMGEIAVSPDGVHVAIGLAYSGDYAVEIWDVRSLSRVRSLKGHENNVVSVAFNHDGTRLLSGSEDRTAILWDPESGRMLHRITEHVQPVASVCFNNDGTRYCTCDKGMGQPSIIWDATSNQKLKTITDAGIAVFSPTKNLLATASWQGVSIRDAGSGGKIRDLGASRAMLNGFDISANSQRAVVVAGPRTIFGQARATRWDINTCRPVSAIEEDVGCAVYTRDGKRVACSVYDRGSRTSSIVIRDGASNEVLDEISMGPMYVSQMKFDPDGRTLAVLPIQGPATPLLVDVESGTVEHKLDAHRTLVHQAVFTPDDGGIVTCDGGSDIAISDVLTGEVSRRIGNPSETYNVSCIALSSSGGVIAAGCMRADTSGGRFVVALWDGRTGETLRTLEGHRTIVKSVAFFPGDKRLVSTSQAGKLKVWDVSTGEAAFTITQSGKAVNVVAVRPDGKVFVSGCGDGTLTVFDARTGRILQQTKLDIANGIRFLQFDAPGNRLLAGESLLDATSLREVRRIGEFGHTTIAFSRDGQQVLTDRLTGEKNIAGLWDANTGRKLHSLVRSNVSDQHYYGCAAFSRDGAKVVTGGQWNAVLWDARTGERIRTFRPHSGRVSALGCSADGNRIVTAGGLSETVVVWDRNSGQPLQVIETDCVTQFAAISPDGNTLLAPVECDYELARQIGMYGAVALFDATTGERKRDYYVHNSNNVMLGTFDPSGEHFLTAAYGEPIVAWETATGRRVQEFKGHPAGVTDIRIGPQGRRVFATSRAGTLRVWDFHTGRELAQILFIDDGREWLAVTPEGYFDGSLKGREVVAWKVGDKMFPLEQYERRFHRPDLVARSLQGRSLDGETTVGVQRIPPSVSLSVEETRDNFAVVRAEARPGSSSSSVRSVRIAVNGRDLPVERLRAIVRERRSDDVVVFRAHVAFPPGRDKALVSAVAIDEFDLESQPARVTIARTTTQEDVAGTLYVLAVGVSQYQIEEYNLDYAHADAEALATTLHEQKGKAFAEVESRVLTDKDATVEKVKAALAWLKDSCTPADVAVLLFSGHGVRGRRGLYYVTHEGDLDALKNTCLNWADVSAALEDVRAQAVLFLADCCHAGAFGDRTATQDELAESLVKQAGVMVFASSQGHEKSLERADWRHGAFTQALLTGLSGEADLPIGPEGVDGLVTVSELQTYVSARVAQMTDRRQHPYIPRLARFDPMLVLAVP